MPSLGQIIIRGVGLCWAPHLSPEIVLVCETINDGHWLILTMVTLSPSGPSAEAKDRGQRIA